MTISVNRAVADRFSLRALVLTIAAVLGSDWCQGDDSPPDRYPSHSRLMLYADEADNLHPVTSAADWARRRSDILQGMQAVMGPLPSDRAWPEFDLQLKEEVTGDGYVRKTYTFAVEAGDRLPIDLYLPQSVAEGERRAAVLALHPTGGLGKRIVAGEGAENRQYAVELAQRGYVVLAPDYPSFGDYPYDFAGDDYVSGTMKGIVNHRRCVDLLQSLPQVDPERIGVIGHSLGGHNAIFTAAFDDRIKVIVSSCGWTPFHQYYGGKLAGWASDRYMPRIREVYGLNPDRVPFDFYEVIAALAPRPFLSCSPVEDDNFDLAGVELAIPKAREVYRLLGAEEALQLNTPRCGHDFPTETRLEAYAFLDRGLTHTPDRSLDYASELPRISPLDPAAGLASIEVLPQYAIEQIATEPLVVDPIAMSFDAAGRLYVIEMCDYSEDDKAFLGKVSLLTDTDGDGKFDQSTLFVDKLSWPTAIITYDDGVFVGAPPYVYYFKDTNGDGQADIKRTVFEGFGRTNVQGMMNSFQWGLDNRIHGATSSSGAEVIRPDVPDRKPVSLRGRDFSFDPKTLEIRAESGGAQHGLSFDDWGRKFVCSNSDHCQLVMYDDRYITRNPDFPAPGPRISIADDGGQAPVFRISPVEPWRIVRTRLRASGVVSGVVEGGGRPAGYFTGATGVTIYRGDALPEELRGMAIVGDVGGNLVHRKRLLPNGTSLTATRIDSETEFVRSSDIWFRPVQYANSPDGCLHILDMYREVIEHPHSIPPEIKQHLDLTSGRDRGRLYRIVPPGGVADREVNLHTLSTDQLIELLSHANSWHRETASRLLYERQSPETAARLREPFSTTESPLGRLHRLYAIAGQGDLREADIVRALADTHPGVRAHAVKLSEPFASSTTIQSTLLQLKDDPALEVRFQLAFTAGELPLEQRVPVLVSLLRQDGNDTWVRVAALSSLREGAGSVLALLLQDETWLSQKTSAAVITPLAQLVGRQRRPQDLQSVLAAVESDAARSSSATELTILAIAGTYPEFRQQLRGTPSGKTLEDLLSQAGQTALDESLPPNRRASAIRLARLMTWAEASTLLAATLAPRQPAGVQSATVTVLGTINHPEATKLLLSQWSRLGPAVRKEAEEAICARPAGVLALLTQLEEGTIRVADLSAGRLQLLQTSKNETIRQRAKDLIVQLGNSSRQQIVDQYAQSLTMRGDLERGRSAFRKTCAACHRLEEFGTDLAPNLATMKNRGPEAIILNVLDPNREVNPQYQNYVVTTGEGLVFTGMIQSETGTAITLIRNEGKSDTILRSEIDDFRSTGLSLMPEGLEKEIDLQTMADLLHYLQQVK